MFIGVRKYIFYFYSVHSLKEKRRVINRVKDKIKNMFNCSIAETGYNDVLNKAEIGVAVVSPIKDIWKV